MTQVDHARRLLTMTVIIAVLILSTGFTRTRAAGPLPPGLPNHFALGLSGNSDTIDWMTSSGVPWDMRYQYLAGGVNTGDGWATWNIDGGFATDYMNASAAGGYIPVFNYYQLYQSLPAAGGDEADSDFTNLNTPTTMLAYFTDFKLLLTKAHSFGRPVIIHIEGDLFGYMHQRVINTTNSAASIPAAVASSGHPDAIGLPNTFQGFNLALLRMRDRYAPNVMLAAHVSNWSTGNDIGSSNDPSLDIATIAAQTAAFHNTAGIMGNPDTISSYDLLFFDPLDRDAGYYQLVWHDGGARWWDTTNQQFPNFARYQQFVKGVTTGTNRRAMLWQVPIGNTLYRTENNTDGHYQDNRVQYWLGGYPNDGHLQALADAGVVGLLFGRGAEGPTTFNDAKGDGTTNPAPINGNTLVAQSADDDGGYLRLTAQRYYQQGPLGLWNGPPPNLSPRVYLPLVRR